MVEVRRKDGETTESLIRRFTRRVQHSGKLIQAKQKKYREKEKSKRLQRDDAIRRQKNRKKKEYLRKIGRLDDVRDKKFGGRKRGHSR